MRYSSCQHRAGSAPYLGRSTSLSSAAFTRENAPAASPVDIICEMIERLVVDTNVVVAGVCSSRGASFVVLRGILEKAIRPSVSVPLFLEYESALLDPRIKRLHRLTTADIETLLDGMALCIAPVRLHYLWRPQLRDPDDEMVLETAVNAGARRILTFNQRDFLPAAKQFGVKVVRPGDFVLENRAQLIGLM